MVYVFFTLIGFFPLIYGANLLVDSASALAVRLKIPPLVIGLTIVAFGTSAPEMVVNLAASLAGSSGIVIGNVVGSNIFNVLGILGIASIIYPLAVEKSTTWIEIPLAVLSAAILIFLANDIFFDQASVSGVSFIDGVVLLGFFGIFLAYTVSLAKSGGISEDLVVKGYSIPLSVVLLLIGLGLLVLGGRLIVDNATALARSYGVSERVIALTIISIGTSLPELATSVTAALKKRVDIAIGNVVGSNIFNVFFILGLSALVAPVPGSASVNIDLGVNMGASLLLFLFIFTGRGRRIERWEGIVFLLGYGSYLGVLVFF